MNDVSIIIPCHNGATYLHDAIDSCLQQTVKPVDIVVINDGSTDMTSSVIEYVCSMFPGVVSLQTNDVGPTKARHDGILNCKGEYYIPLDSDDILDPTYIEKMLPVLQEAPGLGFVYCDTVYFGNDRKRYNQPEYDFDRLLHGNFISYASLFRKEAYFDCGGYNLGNWGYFEDWELYIRLGKKQWFGKHVPDALFNYRVRKDSSMQAGHVAKFANQYQSFFVKWYPDLFPAEMQQEAIDLLQGFDDSWMAKKRGEQ
jgi:glycosyltransferase involved in cell wall biosynthesis